MLESTLESGTWFQSDKEPSKWAARDGPGRLLNLPLGHRGCGFCCPPLPGEEAVAFRHHLHSLQMKELAEGDCQCTLDSRGHSQQVLVPLTPSQGDLALMGEEAQDAG